MLTLIRKELRSEIINIAVTIKVYFRANITNMGHLIIKEPIKQECNYHVYISKNEKLQNYNEKQIIFNYERHFKQPHPPPVIGRTSKQKRT